jgi:hypothetical protein
MLLAAAPVPRGDAEGVGDEEAQRAVAAVQSVRWEAYKARLDRLGYFGEERPGSQRYRQLEEKARRQLREALVSDAPDERCVTHALAIWGRGLTVDLYPALSQLAAVPGPRRPRT